MSNLISYKDPLNKVTDYEYDDYDRLIEIEYPASTTGATRLKVNYSYDDIGRIKTLTDMDGRITTYNYFDSQNKYEVINPENEKITFEYNDRFQRTKVIDANSQAYDSKLGRFTTEDPIGFAGKQINLYGYLGNSPLLASDPLGLYPDKPVNYLRDPVSHDSPLNLGGLTNGTANTVSDLLGLDYVAQLGWTIGDYRCSTYDRVKAGATLGGIVASNAFGGPAVSKGLGLAGKGLGKLGKFGKSGKKFKECALCFEAGTKVETKDGSKPIEEIDTDDEVLSYNELTGELEYQEVLYKMNRSADDIYSLTIEGESKPLGVTSEHPFYIKARDNLDSDDEGGEWEETKNLQVGDEIKIANGSWAKILAIKFKGAGQIYNFTVAYNHNYFVGDLKLLNHYKYEGSRSNQVTRKQLDELRNEFYK